MPVFEKMKTGIKNPVFATVCGILDCFPTFFLTNCDKKFKYI